MTLRYANQVTLDEGIRVCLVSDGEHTVLYLSLDEAIELRNDLSNTIDKAWAEMVSASDADILALDEALEYARSERDELLKEK